jgi:serine/tyrosine/threonine adenylyltransferase
VLEEDMDFFSDTLSMLADSSCDFNHFFYRLGVTPVFTLNSKDDYTRAAEHILPAETENIKRDCVNTLAIWLETKYRPRVEREQSTNDHERRDRMSSVNPKFILRQWILEEVIKKTTSERNVGVEDKESLDMVLRMALEPFNDAWGGDKAEEQRLCGDVPKIDRGFQCSCSS